MNNLRPSADDIIRCLNLRKPQAISLKILDNILKETDLCHDQDLERNLGIISKLYPSCTSFERDFISLAFVLATGVGKTRLMGAFIAHLYANYGMKNFFVIAPNITIYQKLKDDIGNPSSPKYVFRGLSCFQDLPRVMSGDDYKLRSTSYLFNSDINIYIFNIDKFNSDNANMRKQQEMIGQDFISYIASLKDLVVIMDESHHYRADKGMAAINDLKPVIGIELTATPYTNSGKKGKKGSGKTDGYFKNVVYEYPLKNAIADGFTRTPYAITRKNFNPGNYEADELDKLMIADGIACHRNIKSKLALYSANCTTEQKPVRKVKPFVLIVCRDTDHAEAIYKFVCSKQCFNGEYRNKTIKLHSKQGEKEKNENARLLLAVEREDNPIEIVIHVNILKEGWDVNNLYTIVPLRTAASKILREQMVGRGLRLPFGERIGETDIDAVMLTAHDNFKDILEEAQKGDSIFNKGCVICAEDIPENLKTVMASLNFKAPQAVLGDKHLAFLSAGTSELLGQIQEKAGTAVKEAIEAKKDNSLSSEERRRIVRKVVEEVKSSHDDTLSLFDAEENDTSQIESAVLNDTQIEEAAASIVDDFCGQAQDKYIPIPQVRIVSQINEKSNFHDFELDLAKFTHQPVSAELVFKSLIKARDKFEKYSADQYQAFRNIHSPESALLKELRNMPEVDYERSKTLLHKLISSVCDSYSQKFGEEAMLGIVDQYKRDIAQKIYEQMLKNVIKSSAICQEVCGLLCYNHASSFSSEATIDLFDPLPLNIRSVTFTCGEESKSVFSAVKFDSKPEWEFAKICEDDNDVIRWLRPSFRDFSLSYKNKDNSVASYEPDFVAETADCFYMVEVKGEDKLEDADVLAKKQCAISYCALVSPWCQEKGLKPWRYLFIPSKEIQPNYSFNYFVNNFVAG